MRIIEIIDISMVRIFRWGNKIFENNACGSSVKSGVAYEINGRKLVGTMKSKSKIYEIKDVDVKK